MASEHAHQAGRLASVGAGTPQNCVHLVFVTADACAARSC
jgi:hypothetical protein